MAQGESLGLFFKSNYLQHNKVAITAGRIYSIYPFSLYSNNSPTDFTNITEVRIAYSSKRWYLGFSADFADVIPRIEWGMRSVVLSASRWKIKNKEECYANDSVKYTVSVGDILYKTQKGSTNLNSRYCLNISFDYENRALMVWITSWRSPLQPR